MNDPANVSLFVDDRGAGTPVVLLHSGGMSSRQWRSLAERLAVNHRVLAPDLLGSGKNPPWPGDLPFGYELDVAAVARVLDRVDGAVHLVGHSYGGLVALTLARTQPRRVRSIALYDPVAFGVLRDPADPAGLADLARAEAQPVFTDESRGGGEDWMEAFVDYWNGPGAWRALPATSREQFLRVGRKVFREVMSLMHDRTGAAAYAGLGAPTLLLSGERSPTAAQRVTEVLAGAMPAARREVIEGAGHMGPLTHGATVDALIARHIDAIDAAA
ncbi:MAG: alpha/beta hydrolase [Deltaproteobacteria bacterium]|nr:alpha/beta hydrolase [Myxococcales bacterium]MDP3220821.1 alpha/beta hydrolase [Deltaproteobacteria bacterium]